MPSKGSKVKKDISQILEDYLEGDISQINHHTLRALLEKGIIDKPQMEHLADLKKNYNKSKKADIKSKVPTKYNVNRYYLNRLNRYDKGLFSGYSVKQQKSKKKGSGQQSYTYARKCQAGRQPIAVTKAELYNINATDEGEGIGYHNAVSIDGRDPNIYYMCPKYWDVKEERPRDPLRVEEFKEHIVDNKKTSKHKKNTDKYILRRDEHGYWDAVGDDITRYKVSLWDNFHPQGYKVPCCYIRREGEDIYGTGWTVDVQVDSGGVLKWNKARVKSATKRSVTVVRGGQIETYDLSRVRRHRPHPKKKPTSKSKSSNKVVKGVIGKLKKTRRKRPKQMK